jgi:hypothetical protein
LDQFHALKRINRIQDLPNAWGYIAEISAKERQMQIFISAEKMYPKKNTGLPPTPTLTER